jgi:hypothetical protein
MVDVAAELEKAGYASPDPDKVLRKSMDLLARTAAEEGVPVGTEDEQMEYVNDAVGKAGYDPATAEQTAAKLKADYITSEFQRLGISGGSHLPDGTSVAATGPGGSGKQREL